jgi:hypothetical protein
VLLVAFSLVAAVVLRLTVLLLRLLQLLRLKANPSKALAHLATSTPRLILSGALSHKPVTI